MKYLHKFNEDNDKNDSPMKRLLSKGKDIEVVTEHKPKSTKHREEVGKKNKVFLDKVEQRTKENDENDHIDEAILKFNEDMLPKIISNDRVSEIISELDNIQKEVDDNLSKCVDISKELSGYTTKSSKTNNQIDDAYVNFELLQNKMREQLSVISSITKQLNDYNEKGNKTVY